MPSPAKENPRTMELKKAKKLKRQKINTKERTDDIPNCPSLESIQYYDNFYDADGASSDISEWSIAGEEDTNNNAANIKKAKEEFAKQLDERQREKDLEEVYGSSIYSISSSDDEEEEFKDAEEKKMDARTNDPFPNNQWEMCRDCSTEEYDPEKEAEERARAERRRQETQELYDSLIDASVSIGKQAAILFAKIINYSAEYPTPAGIALIIFGLYFTVIYLEMSVAALAEWCIQWFWPTTRLFIRCSERLLTKMAAFLHEMDDIGQSTYCDMANLWCERYEMLCEYRCRFIDMAWERARY